MSEYRAAKDSDVTEQTRFSWPVVVALVTAALAVGAAHFRLQMVDSALTKHLDTAAEMQRVDSQHEVRITRLEDSFARVEKALERIDRKLDRLTEAPESVRPAVIRR